MENKEQLNLSDLGLEPELTPAEKVAKNENNKPIEPIVETVKVEEDKKYIIVDGTKGKEEPKSEEPIQKVSLADIAKSTVVDEDGNTKYDEVISNVDTIAKVPKSKVDDPIRKNLDSLYDLADHEIERTKKELTDPDGLITKGKEEYVNTQYEVLMKRAKSNERLSKFIKQIEDIIETEPRFDGITDYERKGYILFTVAHDEKVETNNKYFGIEEKQVNRTPRMSSDVSKDIDSITKNDDDSKDDFLDLLDDSSVDLGVSPKKPDLPYEDDEIKEKDDEDEETFTTVKDKDVEKEINTAKPILAEEEDPEEKELLSDVEEDEEPNLSEEEVKRLTHDYKEQVLEALKMERNEGLDEFVISKKPIKLKSALQVERSAYTVTFGLQYTGKQIEMTPVSGEELLQFNPQTTDLTTIGGLRKFFNIIYNHTVGKKPDIDTWLKQISVYDLDCMLFTIYMANFKDVNYLSYQCPNNKCNKLFLEKKKVEDMIVYPNDKVKERFQKILNGEPVQSKLFRTKPIIISKDYAFSFCTESIYGDMIERAALTEDFSKKYSTVVQIMANIDTIYKVNRATKELYPIDFGVVEDSLSKTVMRKVKAIYEIMRHLSPDEHSALMGEVYKITRKFTEEKISYQIPATECTSCHTHIDATPQGSIDLLFTRAFLPIGALSIQ